MTEAIISAEVKRLLSDYRLPKKLGFGRELAPVMYRAEYRQGRWQPGALVRFAEITVNPAATSLQFAQQAFEGMKAYQARDTQPRLFRPKLNYRRFNESAWRLCMPDLPATLFAEALAALTGVLQPFIPTGAGQSLYLRPTLLGLDPHFAVQGSDNFVFLLLASPSDAYYADPIRVLVERRDCRAAVGGTGAAKVGGNYGASLQAAKKCRELGLDQSLWLDPQSRINIEELSAMNFMAVVDGQLHTPALSGSILNGVTRASLLTLAEHIGIEVSERTTPVDELLQDVVSGRCSEAFACGTGAIISPISQIAEADGSRFELRQVDKMAARLKTALLNIQEGRVADPFGWMIDATDAGYLANCLVS